MPKLSTRSLLLGSPLLGFALLAGCGQKPATAPANGAVDNGTVANETAAAPAAPQTVAYDCMPAQLLSATYDNSTTPAKARLTIGDKSYDLTGVEAASGARYVTDQGRSAGKTLVWATQGQDGTLSEGKVGGTAADEKKVASCSPRRS